MRLRPRHGRTDARAAADLCRFECIYESNYDAVLAYALARTDTDTARDVVADTFLVAWRRLADVPSEPRGWLIGVARRVLADHRRAAGRRDALTTRMGEQRQETELAEPADLVTSRDHVVGALLSLSASDQELLRLVAWEGLSSSDAAAVLGCTRAGFAVRLHRARRRFESALAAGEPITAVRDLPASQRPELVGSERAEGIESNRPSPIDAVARTVTSGSSRE